MECRISVIVIPMARVNIKHLEAFTAVADLSSFRRAATALNTTQPNISARIAALEAQIGQKLMERDAGSVRLTPAGTLLLKKARSVLDAVDDFMDSAGAPGLFEGTLRLGVTEIVVHSWLGDFLSALRHSFPNVMVDLTVDLSSNLSDALFGHAIDLALQSGPFNRRTSGAVDLGGYPMVWVAAPRLGAGKRVLTPDALTRFPIVTHARQTLPFQQLEKHLATERGVRFIPSTSLSACLRMSLQGLGVACLPEAMVKEEIARGTLDRLRYLWVPDDLAFMARFHAERAPVHLRRAAQLAGEVAAGYNTA